MTKIRKPGPVDPKPKRRPANGRPVQLPPPSERPKKGPGSGKPNAYQRAKRAGAEHKVEPVDDQGEPIIITMDVEGLLPACGRPTLLTPDLGSRVCTLTAQGHTYQEIGEIEGMPSEPTIFRWLAHSGEGPNGKLYEAFRVSLARARQLRASARASRLEAIARQLTEPGAQRLDPGAARVASDIQQFLMSVEDPGRFSKKVTVQGDPAKPIEHKHRHALTDDALQAIAAGMDIDNAD